MVGRFVIYLKTYGEPINADLPTEGAAEQMISRPGINVGFAPDITSQLAPNYLGNSKWGPVKSGQASNNPGENGLDQDMRIQAGMSQEPQRGNSFVDSMLSIFDSNNDGFLTKVEARKAASQFDIGSRELKGALNTIGIDKKEDNIPLDSMSEQIKRICVEKFKKTAFKHFFSYMDSDKSGTISLDEVLSAIQAFNMPASISLARQIFDSVDSNKDGEIDLKEFLAFLASVKDTFIPMVNDSSLNQNTSFSNTTRASSSGPDILSLHFSIWLIVLLSLTSLFAIWFILCGLFRRADAYRTPFPGLGDGGYTFGGLDDAAFGEGGGTGSLFGGMHFDGDV
ncbi:hypothetical protein ECG_06809 [Echinococcus granulosus]|uniref:Calcium dependent protein kinase n=1 Tax=Echinococcus granulosus TaxID=6210 RepID=A0A068WG61_ECHGR|nr:hypothetical protein ECG_06809 [Echinococcus granulosus]CDS19098.1 calcium dependent protein kinase [Echinococcus granulosus]